MCVCFDREQVRWVDEKDKEPEGTFTTWSPNDKQTRCAVFFFFSLITVRWECICNDTDFLSDLFGVYSSGYAGSVCLIDFPRPDCEREKWVIRYVNVTGVCAQCEGAV